MTNEEIIKGLKALKLTYLAENLTDFCREHGGPRANVRATLSDLVKKELDGSRQRSLERRLVNSKLDVKKLKFMADFDWSWPEGIDRGLVDSLLGLGFMKEPANVILAGTEGRQVDDRKEHRLQRRHERIQCLMRRNRRHDYRPHQPG
jgi:hypothetical protein